MRCLRLVRCVRVVGLRWFMRLPPSLLRSRPCPWSARKPPGSGRRSDCVVRPPSLYVQTAQAVARAHADRTGTAQTVLENQVLVLTPWRRRPPELDVADYRAAWLIDDADGAVGDLYVSMTQSDSAPAHRVSRFRVCRSVVPFLLFL